MWLCKSKLFWDRSGECMKLSRTDDGTRTPKMIPFMRFYDEITKWMKRLSVPGLSPLSGVLVKRPVDQNGALKAVKWGQLTVLTCVLLILRKWIINLSSNEKIRVTALKIGGKESMMDFQWKYILRYFLLLSHLTFPRVKKLNKILPALYRQQ